MIYDAQLNKPLDQVTVVCQQYKGNFIPAWQAQIKLKIIFDDRLTQYITTNYDKRGVVWPVQIRAMVNRLLVAGLITGSGVIEQLVKNQIKFVEDAREIANASGVTNEELNLGIKIKKVGE